MLMPIPIPIFSFRCMCRFHIRHQGKIARMMSIVPEYTAGHKVRLISIDVKEGRALIKKVDTHSQQTSSNKT